MAGPAASIAEVPVPDALPRDHRAAADDIRRLARRLETHRAAVDRVAWHWYPDHVESRPPGLSERDHVLLLDTTISLVNTGQDWLELTLDLAWQPELTVNAAVEVACWCQRDHNMHQVRQAHWPAASRHDLVNAFAAGVAMLMDVLDAGLFDPRTWRVQAGLPDAPATAAQ